ncbi:Coenzyme F420 hydrogenase/dehydrogenase, beta subunit C-terminal domain [Aliamphritea ceti]|uniref:Coenzyme F420 hydrogenase/dehydrogenase, beta subunit C-terminal domain n=1 Tax=Aliamphritea ceti TaxID=1524258 RepID=UPI0021C2F037|nr:Coenzyme F420 hydrogenase/dehydrogenase, beta subunit C-terminal domain [Aliamphritea ceti]
MTNQNDRFYRIVEDGVCIGCGLCQSLTGEAKVRMTKSQSGELRPQILNPLSESDVDRVYATCPSTRAEGLPAPLIDEAPNHDPVWGPYHQLSLGWAGNPEIRHMGATGGVLTALASYLLASKKVAFILHVKASVTEPTFGEATLSFTEADVLEASGSRYGPTAPLIDINAALDRGEPFALIAKSCDLNAVRNLAHLDPRVNQLIRYWLTPVCGGYMPDTSMDRFLNEQEIQRSEVTALRYRGFGCPGPTTVHTADGKHKDVHYLDFWGEDESAWSLPFRCKICPDGIGDGADIAAADTWQGGSPDRLNSETDLGTNSLIIRTQAGMQLVTDAVNAGALVLGDDVDIEFMNTTQPHQVTKKKAAQARYNGLAAAGILVPETEGLRIQEIHQGNTSKFNYNQQQGAFERAERHKEPRPVSEG